MSKFYEFVDSELAKLREEGLYKDERWVTSSQRAVISTHSGEVINFCANNYLGLSSHPDIIEAAHRGLDERGFGMSSVRFICGTQDIHKELEAEISRFLSTEDTILYSSCFDANGGLFETLFGPEDIIISDALNHASIIDGIRLCKAQRRVYAHLDMLELENILKESSANRARVIATDGVFSMDGDFAPLDQICELADKYNSLVMVDDSHSTGFIGPNGRGTPEKFGVADRIDILTSTSGKALGGASGGFTSGKSTVVEFLRQRSRPYLFSNSVAPPIVYGTLTALNIIRTIPELRTQLMEKTNYFRSRMTEIGFTIRPGDHPIVPIMLEDAALAKTMAEDLLHEGIYVVSFSYPVVPKGKARIRVQISAAHTQEQLDKALDAFRKSGIKYRLLK